MFRRFGTLADISNKHVGKAIDYFRSLSLEEKIKAEPDLPTYATQLFMYGGTTKALEELKNFTSENLKKPIILDQAAKEPLRIMVRDALYNKNMADLDIAIHFLWHNFKESPFPYKKILNSLLPLYPIGSTENKELWKKIVAEVFYYAIPNDIDVKHVRNFAKIYSDQPYSFPTMAKIAHEFEDKKQSKFKRVLNNLYNHYSESISDTFIDKKNYELAKGYIKNLLDQKQPVKIEPGYLSSLINWAAFYEDADFIFQTYEAQNLINEGTKINELYAQTMDQISLLDIEGEYIPIMEKIINKLKLKNERYYREIIFENEAASSGMIRSYIKDGRYEDAIVFMYDLNRLGYDIPIEFSYQLAELAFNDKKARLIQMIKCFDAGLSGIEINTFIIKLREEMDKNGELLETKFVEEKYYTQSSKYLIPILLSKRLEVKGIIGPDDKYEPYTPPEEGEEEREEEEEEEENSEEEDDFEMEEFGEEKPDKNKKVKKRAKRADYGNEGFDEERNQKEKKVKGKKKHIRTREEELDENEEGYGSEKESVYPDREEERRAPIEAEIGGEELERKY